MKATFWLTLGSRLLIDVRRRRLAHHIRGSVLGIGLSLIPLIVVLEVSDGMIEGITNRFLEIGTYHLQVHFWEELDIERLEALTEQIGNIPGVREGFVERQGVGLLHAGGRRYGVTVRAVPAELYSRDPGFDTYFDFVSGNFDLQQQGSILVGRGVAEKIGITIGDRVLLLTAARRPGGAAAFAATPLTVRGVFSSGYQELDLLWAYIPLELGQRVLKEGNAEQFIAVKVQDPFAELSTFAAAIRDVLPLRVQIYTWYELQYNRYKTYKTVRLLLIFIMGLVVVVASVNISSAMVMIVLEKGQEIGMLRSMGAAREAVKAAFVFCGFAVGTVGSVVGIVLGLFISVNINEVIAALEMTANIAVQITASALSLLIDIAEPAAVEFFDSAYYLERIPVRLRPLQLLVVAALTAVMSAAAAYLPARRAAQLTPLEVIRKY